MPQSKLNATAASLLGFLHERPMAGWDLVSTAQARIGDFWSITPSQVYRELASMSARGLIAAGERGSRDRLPYELTGAGKAAFQDWVLQEPGKDLIRVPMLLTTMFGEHLPPERLAKFLENYREHHAHALEEYERILEGIPADARESHWFSIATLQFGIAYERAVVEWCNQLPASIRGPSEAGE